MSDTEIEEWLCGGIDNTENGCQQHFPRMESGTPLCPLCKKLDVDSITQDEKNRILGSYVQCMQCGLAGERIRDPCGTCVRKAKAEEGTSDPHLNASKARRKIIVETRTGRSLAPSATSNRIGATTGADELSALRSNQGKVGQFTVVVNFRRSDNPRSINNNLGMQCIVMPETNLLHVFKQRVLANVNLAWTARDNPCDLLLDETELRAPNNLALGPGHEDLTMRQWYNSVNTEETRAIYIKVPAGKDKGISKGSAFMLELFIHVDQYEKRVAEMENSSDEDVTLKPITNTGKRGKKSQGQAVCTKRGKANNGTVLKSSFVPDTPATRQVIQAREANMITFQRTVCNINAGTGTYTLARLEDKETGLLDVATMQLAAADRGRTKDIYHLTIGSEDFVAKKLTHISDEMNDVPPEPAKAYELLTQDLIRLKRMAYFAKSFSWEAGRSGVEIADFKVSDAFVIATYADPPAVDCPDPVTSEETSSSDDDEPHKPEITAAYLVEPLRASSAVTKFTGTLGARSNRRDKRTGTMQAFSHFVMAHSACQYMFSDIQGSIDNGVLILFDPMTHTPTKLSGLGDHGMVGLRDFEDSHICSVVCNGLKLASMLIIKSTLDSIEEELPDPSSEP